ncbi:MULTISPECIES: TetR/AcrR family transcriptional regulator [unclassified Corynebacterium]|uniref:TetR/AcrR family transcriptional regulator n=1 Tax=unclassified Corynebacterium TaxID=2624378 RepID=UPI00163DB786|nr:TetR/AcrR family transcriptional regulator [Corynebacterium sp. SY003]
MSIIEAWKNTTTKKRVIMDDRYSNRRQREQSQREELLLDIALTIAKTEGLHKVSPGEIAKNAEYSRATIYKIWSSREDVLAACTIRSIEKQLTMYRHILPAWEHKDPVSVLVIFCLAYLWYIQHNPTLFNLSLIGRAEENLSACSPDIKQRLSDTEAELAHLVFQLAHATSGSDEKHIADSINAMRAMLTGLGLFSNNITTSPWHEGITNQQTAHTIVQVLHGLGWDTTHIQVNQLTTELHQQLEGLERTQP